MIIIKISKIICYIGAAAYIFVFSIFIYNAFYKVEASVVDTSNLNINSTPAIIIDAGHGGEDSGAVGVDNILEKDINLSISMYLKELIEFSGFQVVMIREEDISIYNADADTIKEKKVSDMKNRLKIYNSSDNNIIISIHQNQFSESKYYGAQMFYSKNNSKSKELAECVRKAFIGFLQPDNNRELKQADDSIYLLKNTQNPAIIVECGFISNESEAHLLQNSEYQRKVAYAIYCGFLEYYNYYN